MEQRGAVTTACFASQFPDLLERTETRGVSVFCAQLLASKSDAPRRIYAEVTHQLTITALTGSFPASGEGLVLKLGRGGTFEVIGAVESER